MTLILCDKINLKSVMIRRNDDIVGPNCVVGNRYLLPYFYFYLCHDMVCTYCSHVAGVEISGALCCINGSFVIAFLQMWGSGEGYITDGYSNWSTEGVNLMLPLILCDSISFLFRMLRRQIFSFPGVPMLYLCPRLLLTKH